MGSDVAPAPLDLARRPTGERWAVTNDAAGIAPSPRRARRRPRIARRTAEHHRLGGASQRLRADIQAPMTWLDTRLATRDAALETMRRASPVWREHEEVLRRVPGLGPGCTRPLWLDLPELGPWRRQRLAALGGVAPWPRDRGTLRGTRTVWGGRTHGRAAWSMRTLVAGRYHPVLTGCSQRLRTAGKAAKVALTACMRQL